MEEVSMKEKIDFIIGTGDNFYDPAEANSFGLGLWDLKRMKNHSK